MRRKNDWHHGPAWAWVAAFVVVLGIDTALGRWVTLPIFVMGFYGGMIVIDLVTYPLLRRWRDWLHPRGVRAWYLAEVGGLWIGTAVVLALLAPWWLDWSWDGALPFQVIGALVLVLSVGVGTWAAGNMGWARLLFASALFPPAVGAQDRVPQRLVVEGPYRYVRNPLYDTDVGVILGTALLTSNWGLIVLTVAYLLQLGMQLYLEERELKVRFGETYARYCRLVPRFIPRLGPVDQNDIHEDAQGRPRR
jgi:protein-S-isoprenylcysteine O-methyltransferase Ste14